MDAESECQWNGLTYVGGRSRRISLGVVIYNPCHALRLIQFSMGLGSQTEIKGVFFNEIIEGFYKGRQWK